MNTDKVISITESVIETSERKKENFDLSISLNASLIQNFIIRLLKNLIHLSSVLFSKPELMDSYLMINSLFHQREQHQSD